MIDRFQKIARKLRLLRLPALAVGFLGLAVIVTTIFMSQSREGDRFLVPAVVALLWAMSTYAFVETFQSVPAPVSGTMSWFARLGRRLRRIWYWLIALVFVSASMAAVVVAFRMLVVWWRNYV